MANFYESGFRSISIYFSYEALKSSLTSEALELQTPRQEFASTLGQPFNALEFAIETCSSIVWDGAYSTCLKTLMYLTCNLVGS